MTIKGFKFEPVAWMTTILGVLVALEAVQAQVHVLPASWTAPIAGAIAILTAVLGYLARNRTTALAAPRDDAGNRLVPSWAAGPPKVGNKTAPPPSGGGIGGAGMHSW